MKRLQRLLSSALCAALLCGSFGMARAAAPDALPDQEDPAALNEVWISRLTEVWTEDDPYLQQTDLANLIHEAQLWATGAQASLLPAAAVGTLSREDDTESDSLLYPADCGRLYTRETDVLCTVELTGLQLKDWLETVAQRYVLSEDGTLSGEGDGIDQLYGISYELFLGNPDKIRVGNITYQGKRLSANETYRVAVADSRLTAVGQEDLWGWFAATGVSPDSPKVVWNAAQSEEFGVQGGTVTAILEAYLRFLSADGNEIAPPTPQSRWRLYNTTSEVALKPVTRLEFVEALHKAAGSPAGTRMIRPSECFTDIPYAPIDSLRLSPLGWAILEGIVAGDGTGQFLPNDSITREQALVMLLRYDRSRQAGPEGAWAVALPYTDAAMGSPWAAEALMWNVLQNYLLPDDGGNLNPQANLTATQLSEVLERLERMIQK